MKKCVICGTEFNAKGMDITCSEKCSKIRKNYYDYKYNSGYYNKNREKWRWYYENREVRDWGTGELGEHVTRDKEGIVNFATEKRKLKREMVRLGLRKNI